MSCTTTMRLAHAPAEARAAALACISRHLPPPLTTWQSPGDHPLLVITPPLVITPLQVLLLPEAERHVLVGVWEVDERTAEYEGWLADAVRCSSPYP